jgi:hypothetical protein
MVPEEPDHVLAGKPLLIEVAHYMLKRGLSCKRKNFFRDFYSR